MQSRRLAAAVAALALAASPARAQLFDFEGVDSPVGTLTPLVLTRGGVTATFVGTPGPLLIANPGVFATLVNNILGDNDPIAKTLEITFSVPQTSASLMFALNDPTNTAILTMNLLNGGAFVDQVVRMGAIPPGPFQFPEGVLSFSGPAFDQVFIFASGAPDFVIDNLQLGPAAVIPEPATVALLATGLLAVGGAARRRRRAA
jgi:hypothetical protein